MRVLMFPLPMHQGAREQCVAVICDKKGFEDLEAGYKSENQCAEGVQKVDETIAFLKGKGIGSTPTYIFPDGRIQSGALNEEQLAAQLGITGKKPVSKPVQK